MICFLKKLLLGIFIFLVNLSYSQDLVLSEFSVAEAAVSAEIDKDLPDKQKICLPANISDISSNNIDVLDNKSLIGIIEKKSISLFNNTISLMYKCDKYEAFWQYRKKNLSLYFLSNGKIANVFKSKRDFLEEINRKLEFFEKKKIEYASFAGNIYKIAEVFIEGSHLDIQESEVNNFLNEFTRKIDSVLPANYSDSYFIDERKELKKLMPDNKKEELRKKYYLAGAGTIVALVLLIKYRKVLSNFAVNFWSNQIVKPLRSLRDWFLADTATDAFLNLGPEEMITDLEAQKSVIKGKILDFASEVDPKANKSALDEIARQAKSAGVEGIVAKCIKKGRDAGSGVIKTKTKPGWIEWMFFGNRINEIFGMSPKAKILESEIKVLLSRLVATKLLIDVKDGLDSNKITMIIGSMAPMIFTGLGIYLVADKFYKIYKGVPQKKLDIDNMMLKISAIIHKNIGKESFDSQDQGLLCYFVHRLKKSMDVIPEHLRSNIAADLSYISSSLNCMQEKMQILQSLKIMLYIK